MPECIHGFDEGLCDSCFPRRAPEPRKVPQPTRRASVSGATRRPRTAMSRAGEPPALDLVTQRAFHVTHVRNLEAILRDGVLRADAEPEVELSSEATRGARSAAVTPLGTRVSEHVPFFLSPEATRWRELRAIANGEIAVGPEWAAAAAEAAPSDFVILAVPVRALETIVVSDGDASSSANFASGVEDGTRLLRDRRRQLLSSSSLGDPSVSLDLGLHDAELLADATVPVSAIALIGVANEPVRDQVRAMLGRVGGISPKVAVYPPWFLAGDGV